MCGLLPILVTYSPWQRARLYLPPNRDHQVQRIEARSNGVRYRGAIPEASTKFDAEKAETKIRQDVYEGRYGRPTGNKDFGKFVEEVYKPWAMENKRSFKSNDKYKLSIICESKCFKGKTFAQISPLLIEKHKKERREALLENGRTRKPSTINRELGILSKIFSLAIKYGITYSNPWPRYTVVAGKQ
jgi:hypothetical protein